MTVFRYHAQPDGSGRKRPYAQVVLTYRRRTYEAQMLVDSGADVSLIPFAVGVDLGMRQHSGEPVRYLRGAGGRVPVLPRRVTLRIGEHPLRAQVAWVQDSSPLLILGRSGAFSRFSVEFREFEYMTVFRHVGELDAPLPAQA